MNAPTPPSLEVMLDLTLEQCGWKQANALWEEAKVALSNGEFAKFDQLMREFRVISDQWNTQGEAALPNKRAASNQ